MCSVILSHSVNVSELHIAVACHTIKAKHVQLAGKRRNINFLPPL